MRMKCPNNTVFRVSSMARMKLEHSTRVPLECTNSHRNAVKYFFPLSLPSVGSEVKAVTKDRVCDNVLLGQGYCTSRGAVIDEYGAVVE
jgi:hypothetical protein